MKKLLSSLIILCLLPILLLGGCSDVVVFKKTESTYSNSTDFFGANYKNMTDFKTLIKEYNITNTADGIATNYGKIWNNIEKANKEVLFALTAYDMYSKNDENSCPYDISVLSSKENVITDGLGTFLLNRIDPTKKEYVYYLNNQETSGFLPKLEYEKASFSSYQDVADELIKTWGRVIKFSVTTSDNRYYTNIDVSASYVFPLEKDVPNQIEEVGSIIKIERGIQNIKIVYRVDGNIYSKVVFFNNGVKTVQKYDRDITTETTLPQTDKVYTYSIPEKSYIYEENSPELFGKYDIIYDATKSFIYCKHLNNITEFYSLKNNTIMARYNFEDGAFRNITEILINGDKISGNIVNKKTTTLNSGDDLRSLKVLNSNYATYNLNVEQQANAYYVYKIHNQKINVKTK